MKKISLIIIVFVLLLVTGCTNTPKNTKKLICTRTITQSETNTTIDLKYEVYYDKNEYVVKSVSNEKVESSSLETLGTYQKAFEEAGSMYDSKYASNTVSLNGNTLIALTTIDYTKLTQEDASKFNGESMFESNGKVKLSTLKEAYESQGTKCE